MKTLIQPTIILLLFVLIFCVDVVASPSPGARKLVYGALGVLALLYLILTLFIQ